MQPFEYVILFFGSCLLYGLFRAFHETHLELRHESYESGRQDAANTMFVVPQGFGQFAMIPSPLNPDPDFVDRLVEDVDEVDLDITKQTFTMKLEPSAPEPSGFLFTTLRLLSQSPDEEVATAAELDMRKFRADLEDARAYLINEVTS